MFSEKDATFIERKTQTKGAAAYELFNHPGWFMCHDTSSKFGLVARKVEIKSQDFLLGCLYMAVAQKPTKQDLKERLKLSDEKNESGETKGTIRNVSGIISNDVSADNLIKAHPGNGSESSHDKPESLVDNQSSKTNEQQLLSKSNATVNNDEVPSKLSNSTTGKNITSPKTMDQETNSTSVNNSTKETSDFKSTDQLRDVNVTEDVHVTNVTQKPKIDLPNKLAAQNDKKKVEDLVANNLNNSSKLPANANNGKQVALPEQTNPSADEGSAAVKQTAQALGQGITSVAAKTNPQYKGDTLALQKNQNGLPSPFAPKPAANANLNTLPKQFTMHLEFPNGKQFQNSTFADGKTPSSSTNQLAQIAAQATAAALGLIQNAVQNQQPQQQAPKFTKAGAGFPFQQQQRQQKHFQPVNYVNQQMRPQAMFRAVPNYITAPAPMAPGRPLVSPFTVKGRNSQFAYQQFKPAAPQQLFNNGYNYQYPGKGWRGLVSVGKQSLVGNSAKFHGSVENKSNAQEKSNSKLEDETASKISEENGKRKKNEGNLNFLKY